MRAYNESQHGRLLYPGTEQVRTGPERPQRISRVNRSGGRIHFGAAVTDAIMDGCVPPQSAGDRILGFTLQVTEDDIMEGMDWVPQGCFYAPGDICCVSQNDRIKAIAPCDVFPGDPVYIALGTGLPAATGVRAGLSAWETTTMAGTLGVIQIYTRVPK